MGLGLGFLARAARKCLQRQPQRGNGKAYIRVKTMEHTYPRRAKRRPHPNTGATPCCATPYTTPHTTKNISHNKKTNYPPPNYFPTRLPLYRATSTTANHANGRAPQRRTTQRPKSQRRTAQRRTAHRATAHRVTARRATAHLVTAHLATCPPRHRPAHTAAHDRPSLEMPRARTTTQAIA